MDTAPPSYSQDGTSAIPLPCPPVLINLAPSSTSSPDESDSEATTFQIGDLGTDRAYVAGEVQLKFTRAEPDVQYDRLEVAFRGIETVGAAGAAAGPSSSGQHITLVDRRTTLWQADRSATEGESASGIEPPPASTPFRFELTADLPTCIHLGSSSLFYDLTAILYPPTYSTAAPITRTVPVHLVRTAPPAALVPARPATVTASDPISWRVRFPRTTFTRREPIGLVVRVEVPESKRIGQGLRLRTVSAELVRTISAAAPASASSAESSSSSAAPGPRVEESRRTVLAHSGKSARFSPSRPIIIRLVLHPPIEPTCESITQSTILHNVSFAVIVTVGLVKTGSDSTPSILTSTAQIGPLPCDSVLSQEITILPDLPAISPPTRSDKQKEVERAAESASASSSSSATLGHAIAGAPRNWDEEHPDAPVPSYVENSLLDPGTAGPPLAASSSPTASTSASWPSGSDALPSPSLHAGPTEGVLSGYALTSSFGNGDDEALDAEDEYDGYEELSLPASLSDRPPPPRIDDDISPPSAGEPSSAVGFRLATVTGGVIDVEEDERGEPESGARFAGASARGTVPPGAPSAIPPSADSPRSSLGEPETPPPPVEYSLPFLSAPTPRDPSRYDTGSTPDLASLSSSVSIPSYSEPATDVPSSPPPPVSPLTPEHPPLPPFSASIANEQHEPSPRAQQPRQTRTGSDSLPPPYAGRESLARSPPALRAAPLPELQSSTGAQPLAARGPPRGAELIESPPPAFAISLAGEPSRAPPPPLTASANSVRDVEESTAESQTANPTGREGDDEPRPPPYEQRDDGPTGPSGIQWGMMSNRRGELVL